MITASVIPDARRTATAKQAPSAIPICPTITPHGTATAATAATAASTAASTTAASAAAAAAATTKVSHDTFIWRKMADFQKRSTKCAEKLPGNAELSAFELRDAGGNFSEDIHCSLLLV